MFLNTFNCKENVIENKSRTQTYLFTHIMYRIYVSQANSHLWVKGLFLFILSMFSKIFILWI